MKNREIKFRAKDQSTNDWVFGYYYEKSFESHGWIVIDDYEDHTELYGNPIEDLSAFIPVDKDTVSEFTGLKDKNGKEIYEGDVLNVSGEIAFIVWDELMWGLKFYYDETPQCIIPSLLEMEIIGNIYENPELLS